MKTFCKENAKTGDKYLKEFQIMTQAQFRDFCDWLYENFPASFLVTGITSEEFYLDYVVRQKTLSMKVYSDYRSAINNIYTSASGKAGNLLAHIHGDSVRRKEILGR